MKRHARRNLLLIVLSSLALMGAVMAQETQRVETFGGYSFVDDHSILPRSNTFSGWDTSSTVFLNRWFGLTSDFSGHYGSYTTVFSGPPGGTDGKARLSGSTYTFLFGPHFTYRRSRYAPFGQALFGFFHSPFNETILEPPGCPVQSGGSGVIMTCSVPTSGGSATNGFAMAVGGGLDIALGHGFSLRPVQAEYLLRHFSSVVAEDGSFPTLGFTANSFRYSTGIVFRFGPVLGAGR